MHNRVRRIVSPSALIAMVAMVALTLGVGAHVLAHSGLGAASPAPGATVGGEIDQIELRYNRTVADVTGSVTDPDGNEIDSEVVQDGNLKVTIFLATPLSTPGEHAVRHVSTDVEDGDRVEAAYLFTYDRSAPPPQLEILPDEDGFPWARVVLGAGLVAIAFLAWRLRSSMRRAAARRRDAIATDHSADHPPTTAT